MAQMLFHGSQHVEWEMVVRWKAAGHRMAASMVRGGRTMASIGMWEHGEVDKGELEKGCDKHLRKNL